MKVIIENNTFDFDSGYNPHKPSDNNWRKQNQDAFKLCNIGGLRVFVKRFEKEASSIPGYEYLVKTKNKRLPALPLIYDIVHHTEGGKKVVYLFQEALEGNTLEEIMHSRVFAFNPKKFVKSIYMALLAITQNGFWFTDFVEKNIFISKDGDYYLIDLDSVASLSILPNEDNAAISQVNKNYKIAVTTYWYRDTLGYPFTYIAENLRGDTINFLELFIFVAQIKYHIDTNLTLNFLEANTRKAMPKYLLNKNKDLTLAAFKSCLEQASKNQKILPLNVLEFYVNNTLFPNDEIIHIDFLNKKIINSKPTANTTNTINTPIKPPTANTTNTINTPAKQPTANTTNNTTPTPPQLPTRPFIDLFFIGLFIVIIGLFVLAHVLDTNRNSESSSITTKDAYGSYTERVNGVSFEMVSVEGGTFQMGSSSGENDERPVHGVSVSSFSICKTEVTQALWQAVMGANPSNFKGDTRPVEKVSWEDCQLFVEKLNRLTGKRYRLPTEAEWEYAARGGNKSRGYTYSGSDNLDEVAWYDDNSGDESHAVGQKQANELGLYDMTGNVWEWCSDWYKGYPGSSGVKDYTGSDRVFRGGCWDLDAQSCRSAFRLNYAPSFRFYCLGFRLVSNELTQSIGNDQDVDSQDCYVTALRKVKETLLLGDYESALDKCESLKNCPNASTHSAEIAEYITLCQKKLSRSGNYTERVNGVSFEMVSVEGGTFQMGSSSGESDERPVHSVTLSSFSIGKTEVTQALWQAVMGANPSGIKGDTRPVENVSWEDCQLFVEKLNGLTGKRYRLPTEAEWEYAARGGNKSRGYTYSGSDNLDEVAWYYDYSYSVSESKTHTVGQKQANELGLYDMTGNVWEWCSDWHKGYPGSSGVTDYTGSYRVRRGGGWFTDAPDCRSAHRSNDTPGDRDDNLGFRLVSQ